jgi:hypothetical protein
MRNRVTFPRNKEIIAMIFNTVKTCICALLVTLVAPFSHAVLIGFQPSDQTVFLGDSVSVDLVISGFDASQSLGDYDLNLSFDSSILNLSSVIFGNELGTSLQDTSNAGTGTLNLNELSWESATTLENDQADSFTLATLTFDTLSLGLSKLDISSVFALGDQYGSWLDFSLASGSIEVIENLVNVPEPGAVALFSFGLISLTALRRRIKKTAK